jgi:hypothetical protein
MSNLNSRHHHTHSASRSRRRRIRPRAATLIGIVAVAACAPDRATAPGPDALVLSASVREVIPTVTEQLLYQQAPVTGNQNSISAPQGSEIASDFTVPAGERWRVTRIVVLGAPFEGTLGVTVYRDAGGRPGTSGVASATPTLSSSTAPLDPCCGTAIFAYDVPITFTVDPGRYWVAERGAFFAQKSPTTGPELLIGTSTPGIWLSAPGLGDNGDIAFSVYGTVESVAESLAGLQTTLGGLGLDRGTLNSFQVKLKGATDALTAGDETSACRLLQDLANAISAQSGKRLTTAQASALVAEVQRIRGLIGC